jgi:transposase InsO family protein
MEVSSRGRPLHWWRSIAEARDAIDDYRQAFNEARPHGALGHGTPAEHRVQVEANGGQEKIASRGA